MGQTNPIALTATPVVDTAAYANGDCVGGLLTIEDAAFVAAGTGELRRVRLHERSTQAAALQLWVFNANPTASTFTNNAAMVVHADDVGKVQCVIAIAAADYKVSAASASGLAIVSGFSEIIRTDPAKKLYVALKSNAATPTYALLALTLYLDIVLD